MKLSFSRRRHRVLTGLLLVTLFALPALSPLWDLTLPQSYDGLHRLHRLIEFDQAVRHGVLFPRWAPDLAYGYGYPVFNFFPYGDHYLPELLHLLGLSFSQALAAAFLLYTLLAGWGMYLLACDLFGDASALLAALAYVYAPYQLHNSLVRGNLPEQFSLALFPLVLWAFRRLIRGSERRWFAASTVLFAAFLFSHTALDLMLTPVLLLFLVVQKPDRMREPILALILGSGLVAFFLLPAFFEKGWVRIGQELFRLVDFREHFLSVAHLFSPPPAALIRLLHRPDYEALGWAQSVIALPGGVLAWRLFRRKVRVWVVASVLILVGSVYIMLPQSIWLWEGIPLMPFLFFPSRFMSLACLALAFLAGATIAAMPVNGRGRGAVLSAGAIAVVLLAMPLLYPHLYPAHLVSRNVADALAFERRTGLLGATSYAEYLPLWVKEKPIDSPLIPAYQAGQPLERIERFDATSLPSEGRIIEAEYKFNWVELTVVSPQPFQAHFHISFFPGWKATVDGERVDPVPVGPLGLIGLDLPAGESHVRLWFGDTPWRTVGKAISLVSAGLLLTLVLRRNLWSSRLDASSPSSHVLSSLKGWSVRQAGLLAVLALGLLSFKLVYVDRCDSLFRRQGFDGLHVEEAEYPLETLYGDQVTLLGYDLAADVLPPGDETDLVLYWSQQRKLSERLRVVPALVNPATGDFLPQGTGWVPQGYPLEFWDLDWYTRDIHHLVVPADALPGRYLVTVGLFDERTGGVIGQTVTLISVKVSLPSQDFQPGHLLDLKLGEEIALAGYDLAIDDSLHLTLTWRCLVAPTDDYTVFVHLLDDSGAIVGQADSQPRGGAYPTSIWAAGEVIPDEHVLSLADLVPGDYRLAVGLYRLATGERLTMTDVTGQRLPDDRLLLSVRLP